MPKTLAAEPRSQYATDLCEVSGQDEEEVVDEWFGLAFRLMLWLRAPSGEDMDDDCAVGDEDWYRLRTLRRGCLKASRKGVRRVDRKACGCLDCCCMHRRHTKASFWNSWLALNASLDRKGGITKGVAIVMVYEARHEPRVEMQLYDKVKRRF